MEFVHLVLCVRSLQIPLQEPLVLRGSILSEKQGLSVQVPSFLALTLTLISSALAPHSTIPAQSRLGLNQHEKIYANRWNARKSGKVLPVRLGLEIRSDDDESVVGNERRPLWFMVLLVNVPLTVVAAFKCEET